MFGYPEHVVTAGLLHDILESSDTTALQLRTRFGLPIAHLVEAVSEDPAVLDPVERKARLRQQVASASPEAAAIFAADKLSKVREIRILAACDSASTDDPTARCERVLAAAVASSQTAGFRSGRVGLWYRPRGIARVSSPRQIFRS